MRSLNVLNAFSSASFIKNFKFEKVMIVQTHTHDEKMEDFFNFCKKSNNLH